MALPEDPIERDPWPCWHHEGWENASEYSMQPADSKTRGAARSAYLRDADEDWADVGVWKRHLVPVTRQEAWDDWGREDAAWRIVAPDLPALAAAREAQPTRVPDDWAPPFMEGKPAWRWVGREHPGATAFWVCGPAGHPPPAPTTRADGKPA
jgi:hypothetical protein